jgi:DNA excision repair protein ERCC-3
MNYIERIKAQCLQFKMPLIEEYDFRKDNKTPDLKIELKSTTTVRDY